jgi:hypothetical protein
VLLTLQLLLLLLMSCWLQASPCHLKQLYYLADQVLLLLGVQQQ